jgi:D-alanyl-D-alanine carboxypeptidase (penicillin-binding protein 5/6)
VCLAACLLAVAAPAAAKASPPPGPPLNVRAATLVSPFTGQRLFGVNPDAELAIASTTKLMTALVTLQRAPLNWSVTFPPAYFPAQDSQIGLVPGERMTVRDLLEAMLLPSADDAAYDLAYNVGHGSVGRFIAMMNRDARELHLSHTHYSTPIGLDTPGNYSSADDLVKLAGYLLDRYPLFARIVAMKGAVLHSGNQLRAVANRNDLVARFPWIHGVKTGHTLNAGYVLVTCANRNGMTLLSAVLGTSSEASRDANTLALLGWGFANYRLATPVRAGRVVARPAVTDRPGFHANVIAGRSLSEVVPRASRLRTRLKLPHQLTGPLRRHALVGTLLVLDGGRTVGRVPLLLAQRLPAVLPVTIAARFLTRTSTLLVLAILLGGAVTFVHRRRGQRMARSTSA